MKDDKKVVVVITGYSESGDKSVYGHRGVAKSGIMSEGAEKLGLKMVTINAESEETKALQEILSKIDQEDDESLDGY